MTKAFSKAKKGYDKAEVDCFVAQTEGTIAQLKERIDELNRANADLEGQLKAFKQKQDLIAKSIVSAVQKAEQIENLTKKKYAFDMAQLKAFHERWLSYYNKLLALYPIDSGLRQLNDFNKSMSDILTGTDVPAQQMAEAEQQFKRESKRLQALQQKPKPAARRVAGPIVKNDDDDDLGIPVFNPEESIRDLLRRQLNEEAEKRARGQRVDAPASPKKNKADDKDFIAAVQEDGFSYEECLNPKQELSEILKEIGIELKN